MSKVIRNVAEDPSTEDSHGGKPVVGKHCMGQLPKWECQNDKECRWHN
jgi:hypothetical protein